MSEPAQTAATGSTVEAANRLAVRILHRLLTSVGFVLAGLAFTLFLVGIQSRDVRLDLAIALGAGAYIRLVQLVRRVDVPREPSPNVVLAVPQLLLVAFALFLVGCLVIQAVM